MPAQVFPRELASLKDIFEFLDDFIEVHHVGRSVIPDLQLAVDELFTNLVRHQSAASNGVVLSLEKEEHRIVILIKASGVDSFDPTQAPEPNLDVPLAERKPGGMGIYLARRVVDDLRYSYDPVTRESTVTLVKNLEA